jgi:hypothetical protein
MSKVACPKCKSSNMLTERRPNGNSECLDCKWKGPSCLRTIMTEPRKPRVFKFFEGDIIEDDFEFVEFSAYQEAAELIERLEEKFNKVILDYHPDSNSSTATEALEDIKKWRQS